MARRYDTVTFFSDYGTGDEFVGVVKSIIRSLAPHAAVIDLTHDLPPYDVRAGGLLLARSVQYLSPGVVLGVVDPGVGTPRRAIAVEVGEGESVLVGPDNGLLAPAVAMVGGATRAVELADEQYHLPAPGATFAGRDVFAPVVGHLCTGVDLAELGPAIEPYSLLPGVMPAARFEPEGIVAEVLWVDRFGNAQLNLGPADLAEWGDRVQLRFAGQTRTAVRVGTYAEVGTGSVGLVVDSYGLLSVAVDQHSAASELGLAPGVEVVVAELPEQDGGEPPGGAGIVTPVTLSPRSAGSGAPRTSAATAPEGT